MTNEKGSDDLNTRFLETDEMQDWQDFVSITRKALKADPSAQKVSVPAAFLRRVLSEIATNPLMFGAYRDRHNQLCDEMGLPDEKVSVREDEPPMDALTGEDMKTRKPVQKMKPLSFKGSGTEDDGGEDTGGPF